MSYYTLAFRDWFWLIWGYFPYLVSKEQLYIMKELSSTPYFDKTLRNMVVLKALGPRKPHFSYYLTIFSYFG